MDAPDDQAATGETALLLAGPFDEAGTSACFEHLTAGDGPPRRVLNVLLTRRPGRRIENWRRHVGDLPESFVVLAAQRRGGGPPDATVESLETPGDLTATGVAITKHLEEWSPDERTAFCLHSATAQLQYAERELVYQFLHTLCGHLAERRAVGHVHLNPNAHDERTIETFETLFDAVVTVGRDDTDVVTS